MTPISHSGNHDDHVSHWINQVKEGNSLAAHQLWQHYFDRLVRAARAKLKGRPKGLTDEEDIAISVFESFYRAAEEGRFPDLTSREDLWRVLLRMSARKIIDRHRRFVRQRRGGGNEPLSLDAPTPVGGYGNDPRDWE